MPKNSAAHEKKVNAAVRLLQSTTGVKVPQAMILAGFSKKDISNEIVRQNIVPLLILDSYRCHMMSSVVHRIQDMGVEVIHIPSGCTSLCQPVDVGFNKPFKDRIRRLGRINRRHNNCTDEAESGRMD
jgi:DDE superfamily endonuclease